MLSIMATDYDYSLSTEDNYGKTREPSSILSEVFVGKFAKFREKLDYEYHKYYSAERQLVQDRILDRFTQTIVVDEVNNISCTSPDQNWLVFTAGVMGAGKSHTLKALHRHHIFPLDSFVRVDPDDIRHLLPEFKEYTVRDYSTAGKLTQKEVGYLSEVLTLYALSEGKNVLVDGSLRNADWHKMYIQSVRDEYPGIKIAIIHVTASEDTVLERCKCREAVTGRHVPEDLIRSTMDQLPLSIFKLAPYVDAIITLENENRGLSSTQTNGDAKSESKTGHGSVLHNYEDLPKIIPSPILSRYLPGEPVPPSLTDTPSTMDELMAYFVMSCAVVPANNSKIRLSDSRSNVESSTASENSSLSRNMFSGVCIIM